MSLCYTYASVIYCLTYGVFTSNDTLNVNSFKGVDDFNYKVIKFLC